MIWHNVTAQQVLAQLDSNDHSGLNNLQVTQRQASNRNGGLQKHFYTRMQHAASFHTFRMAATVVWVGILVYGIVAQIWNIRNGQPYSFLPVVVSALVFVGNIVGWMLLHRSTLRHSQAQQQSAEQNALVLRQGAEVYCPAHQLVPGDILLLQRGDLVAADARLIWSEGLSCVQTAVTADDQIVEKQADCVFDNITPLQQRRNMVYAGSTVVSGTARAVVTETGRDTQLYSRPSAAREKTVNQRTWSAVFRLWMPVALAASTLLFLAGWLFCNDVLLSLVTACGFFAGCAGIGWEITYHSAYLYTARQLQKNGVTVCSEETLEKLADVSALFIEKTGVITGEQMSLACCTVGERRFNRAEEEPESVRFLLRLATLCCTGCIKIADGGQSVIADPTESAILEAAANREMYPDLLLAEYPRLLVLPFTSQRRRMSSLHLIEGRYVLIVKGVPETVLPNCSAGVSDAVIAKEKELCADGLRVIAVAYRFLPDLPADLTEQDEQQLTLLGLLGLRDIPQARVMDTAAKCLSAGVIPVVYTGDHPQAATEMARRLGILQAEEQLITGEDIQRYDERQLGQVACTVRVCARTDVQQRRRLLNALQQNGHIVAVSGSRLQDIELLEQADVPLVCTARTAGPVRNRAELLLHKQGLAPLADAVCAGRATYRNVWQAGLFALCTQLAAALTLLVGYIWHATALLQTWQWLVIGTVWLPLLTLWLARRDKYVWAGKQQKRRLIPITSLIPCCAAWIASALETAVLPFAAFSVAMAVQALLIRLHKDK